MKKKSKRLILSNLVGLLLIVFCKILFANPGSLDNSKTMGLGLEVGYILPSESNFNKIPGFGMSFFYSFSKQFRVELKGIFSSIEVQNSPEGLSKGTLTVIPLQLSLQYRLRISQPFFPYIGGGIGYYFNNFSPENNNAWQALGFDVDEKVDSVFGYHFGAGIDFFFSSHIALNIDIRYCIASLTGNYIISEEMSGISHTDAIEVNLNHIVLGTGIKFLF
jgi:outer membrane protein W